MRISDWSSDVCSSDLQVLQGGEVGAGGAEEKARAQHLQAGTLGDQQAAPVQRQQQRGRQHHVADIARPDHLPEGVALDQVFRGGIQQRSEEHTSELKSLMSISYAVICVNKKK